MQRAYGLDRLHRAGIDGRGTLVAIIMSPAAGLRASLAMQSREYGLPAADLRIARPAGDPGPPGTGAAAAEGTLDTQSVHLAAPRARILYLEVPAPALARAVLGDRQVAAAVDAAVRARADVISISAGGVERPYRALRRAIARAAAAGIPVVAGSGDDGATLRGLRGRAVSYPASDPNVTGVGGTLVTLDAAGRRVRPDVAWGPDPRGGASGGGVSRSEALPDFQRAVRGTLGRTRNVPDISMLAASSGSLIVVFAPAAGIGSSMQPIGGTSVAAPLFAGILALARQRAGRPLLDLNPTLYRLARHAASNGIVDITVGDNGSVNARGRPVPGYRAKRGYDLVTGLGTVDAPRLVRALAAAPAGAGKPSADRTTPGRTTREPAPTGEVPRQ